MRFSVILPIAGLHYLPSTNATVLRGKVPISASSSLQVFNVAPDGSRTQVDDAGEAKLQEILCSEQVVSHLVRCSDDSTSATVNAGSQKRPLYPMTDAYLKALKKGYACPLPSPFMEVRNRRCCVGSTDPNVWPNFCPSIATVGSAANGEGLIWELNHVANVVAAKPSSLPVGVFLIGKPELPRNYAKGTTSYWLIAIYFVMGITCMSLYVYVYRKMEEEGSISRGKKHEQVFLKSQIQAKSNQHEFDDDEEDEDEDSDDDVASDAASLSPVHDSIARDNVAVGESVDKVAMSFGLLPGLPRGRSANSTPLVTARGPPGN